ncbi:aldose 1-epimerase family protein [Lacticaseibacillus nasuensis]|uniref:aldose 1-epimerase family protein n=1 Tax=Lacticaseibacillus nasuensis TaxID=944671 RepID=UPI0022459DB2|nr:aldose 1-epimerase family protein [Lacticaseibacillus nasuensis]MCX2454873.1 aldose 1-epimerase family protein [Lacticaseibacillus nasuensis]
MVTLTNDFLTVTITTHGAELTSIKDNHTNLEYLWQADPASWGRHAPVLFPIVGSLKDDTYRYQGQSYHLTQHGFARDSEFTVSAQSADSATFTLTDSPATRAKYPFAFTLQLIYALDNNSLRVTYRVENPAQSPMYFGIGGHPAFRVPLAPDTAYDDYYLEFDPRKSRVIIPLRDGRIDYDQRTLAGTDVNQQISHAGFAQDAQIYELNGRSSLSIKSDRTPHGVTLTTADAPFIGVWSQYPNLGDFVCLEPWWGIADTVDATGELTEKFGINTLAGGATFEHGFGITIF